MKNLPNVQITFEILRFAQNDNHRNNNKTNLKLALMPLVGGGKALYPFMVSSPPP